MATVIDALVMTLGLDTKGLKRGERETADTNRRLREDADKTKKAYELSGARIAQSITSARNAALGFLAVTTAGAGLSGLIRDATTTSAAMGRMARDLGVSTQALSAWERVSQQVGNSAGELTESFAAIQNQIQQFRLLGNAGLSPAFRRLGIQLTDASGNVRSNEDIFRDAIRALNARPAQERETIAGALGLPGRAAANLASVPNGQLDAMLAEQRRNGGVTPEQAAAAQQRQAAWLRFQNALTDAANKLLTDFTPAIVFALEKLRDFANYLAGPTFRPIFEALSNTMRRLASYLGSQEFLDDVQAFITAIRDITAATLEWLRYFRIIPGAQAATVPEGERVIGPDGTSNWVRTPAGEVVASPYTVPGGAAAQAAIAGAGMGGVGAAGQPTTSEAAQRERQAYDFFRSPAGGGYTAEQAAGIVANIRQESNFNPNATHDGGIGFGIAGWNGSRLRRLGEFIGGDPRTATFDQQLQFAAHELSAAGDEAGAGARIRATQTANDAGQVGSAAWLRPRDRFGEMARRGAMAEGAARRLAQPPTEAPGAPPPAPVAATPPAPAAPPPAASPEARAAALGVRIPRAMSPAEAAAAAQGVRIPPVDPGLVTGPDGAALRDNVQNNNQTSSNENHIGAITVHSAATDAGGIARDIGAAIRRYTFVEQSTRGLA